MRTLNGMVDIGAFEDQISGAAPSSQNAHQGVSGSFTLGSFSDQATTAASWSVDVNWGDGSTDTTFSTTSQGSLDNASHTYNTTGPETVIVTLSDSYGDECQYSYPVNVLALTSIAVAPANPSIANGLTQQFTATGTYADGSTADLTNLVTWASSTPSIATISSTGLAQSLATGTTNITAALDGVTSPNDTLTVTAANGSYVVTNTNDSGPGSLRQAILDADANDSTLGAYEYTPDANTVLLDHFDGTTQATYVSSAVSYTTGFSGLNQAISLPSGGWVQESFTPWYNWENSNSSQGTIGLWVNPQSYNVPILDMQWYNASSPPPAGYILNMSIDPNGKLTMGGWNSINADTWNTPFPTGNTIIPLNTWTQVAFTWSPQGSYTYVDGVQDAYSPLDYYPGQWSSAIPTEYIYLNGWGASAFGEMDELRLSDVARTQFNVITSESSPSTISFNIPETDPGYANGVFTIQPLSPLPVLNDNITVDGTTQIAYTGDTNPDGPVIVLNGDDQSTGDGLDLDDNDTVKDLDINGFQETGINMSYSFSSNGYTNNDNQILDNYLGTDPTGTIAVPNGVGVGIVGWGSPFLAVHGQPHRGKSDLGEPHGRYRDRRYQSDANHR